MSETEQFADVVVGTGQAGKPLAREMARTGRKTAIVERDRVGGTCIVRGCTPTKTMWASARVAHLSRRAEEYGVEVGPVSVDQERVRRRKREIVDEWSEANRQGLEKQDGLELIEGHARFVGPRKLVVDREGEVSRRLSAERIFLNTGARPAIPPIDGLDEVDFLDSTSVMELGETPDHLLVLGGGFIGLEFAQMYRRFGAEVTVLERAARLAPPEDEDVSAEIREIFEEDGIGVRTETDVTAAEPVDRGGVRLRVDGPDGAGEVEGSHLLVATGRRPNSDDLGLERAGVETDDRGHIEVNEKLETSADGVWALGDVTGGEPFTHTSYDDFRVVRSQLLGDGDRTTTDRITTYAVFTDPQLGRVGMSESEARDSERDVRVAKLPMTRVARAAEMDETRGFMKAVVDAETDRILGAAVLGVEGGEIAMGLKLAIMGELAYTEIRDAVLAHPTLLESLNNLFMTLD